MSAPKSQEPKRDMTAREAIVCLAALASLLVVVNFYRVKRYYFMHYEPIWLIVYGVFVALSALCYYWFSKKTKPLQERVDQLKPIWNPSAGILAGRSTQSGVDLYVPDQARLGHVQILAATGRGKTVSVIEPWLIRDLRQGRSALLIDGKGDPDLTCRIQRAVRHLGLPHRVRVFDLGNPGSSCTTNPLAHGSPQQITDRIFTAFTFEDPFYRSVQYRTASAVVAVITSSGEIPTFRSLYECLTNPDLLSEGISRCESAGIQSQAQRLFHQDRKERDKQLAGLISQLEPLAMGEVSQLVNGPKAADKSHEQEPGEHSSNNFQTVSEVFLNADTPQLFICLIPTLKYQAIGFQIGKCFLQEMAWAIGERSSHSGMSFPFTPVYLDEFSAFVYPGFHQILNKARSSQVALHLSHQSLGDFSIVSPELATVFNTNTNVKCLLGLNDPLTADFFAKHLGTETEEKRTERGRKSGLLGGTERTGDLSIREVEAYRIHPNRLKNYGRGQGVLHLPTEQGNVTEEIQFQLLCERDLAPIPPDESRWRVAS